MYFIALSNALLIYSVAFWLLIYVCRCFVYSIAGAYNNRNGPERTGMDRNAPELASITGMDIKINLFYATKCIILP